MPLRTDERLLDFEMLKDWIVDRCVEQSVCRLDYQASEDAPEVDGYLYLNDLFESIPKSYFFKGIREVFLVALNDLFREKIIQQMILNDYEGENAHHNFGKNAVGFSYYQGNVPEVKIASSLGAIQSEIKDMSKNIRSIYDCQYSDSITTYKVKCDILIEKLGKWADENDVELPITVEDLINLR